MKQFYLYTLFFVLLLCIENSYSLNVRKAQSASANKQMIITEVPAVAEAQVATVINTPKETSVEFTLPEVNVDDKHTIQSLYPYFYKTHIIEYQNHLNYKELTNECLDIGCNWCDMESKMKCSECKHGFFLFEGKCYTSCPEGFVADIFKKRCLPFDSKNTMTHISYLKAFSIGSCKNMCGGDSIDCSCQPSCAAQGNCCSDYQQCESLIFVNQNKNAECTSKVPNCSLCHFHLNGKVECGQCNPGFFLRSGECVDKCFISDKIVTPNKICLKNQDCRVENCAECIDNNPSVCKSCYNGFFMMNNQCLVSCPGIYRADRISWSCLEAPVFAWYWVFPSIGSCSGRCGADIYNDLDCSCRQDCFRFGNCCQDVEDFCPPVLF